ncbi:MAG TPA: HAMP domain-containing sensor histidine kinase [Polyangiaceae bacterium]
MRFWRSRMLLVIVCAFAVTALAFLSSSIASYLVASSIDDETSDLLSNALPSVRAIVQAHRGLRRLRESTSEAVLAGPPRNMAQANQHMKELEQAVAAEAQTPWYPGEIEIYDERVLPSLSALHEALDDFERFDGAPLDDPALRASAMRLEGAENRVDAALEDWEDVNHEPAFGGAARILQSRRNVARATLYLDIGCSIVALVATLYVIGFARHFEAVMRRNVQLEAERAEELDLVAQRIAHDLMSPLAAVSLTLNAIERKHKDDETARAVQRAQRVLERSRRMVHGIYAFARASAAPAPGAAAPLRAAVSDAVTALLASEGDSGLTVDVQSFEEVDVKMERGLLDTVLTNLLSNASKYTAKAPVRRVTVRARAEATRVHVEVEDTGPGVPVGFVDVVFEPYKRAPGSCEGGLGLGLATVKRLVCAHGGVVGIRHAPSGGAIFWFELPRAPARAAATESAEREAPGAGTLHPRPSG